MSKLKFGIKTSQAVAENFKIFFDRLVRGYRSVTGRDPEGLDLLKIQLEAGEKATINNLSVRILNHNGVVPDGDLGDRNTIFLEVIKARDLEIMRSDDLDYSNK